MFSGHFTDFEIVSHPPELLAVGDEGPAAEGLQLQGFAQVIVGSRNGFTFRTKICRSFDWLLMFSTSPTGRGADTDQLSE